MVETWTLEADFASSNHVGESNVSQLSSPANGLFAISRLLDRLRVGDGRTLAADFIRRTAKVSDGSTEPRRTKMFGVASSCDGNVRLGESSEVSEEEVEGWKSLGEAGLRMADVEATGKRGGASNGDALANMVGGG